MAPLLHIRNSPIQNSPKNHVMGEKQSNTKQSGLRFKFAAITGSKILIKSYPLLASSQHVGATAAVTILFVMFFDTKYNSPPAGFLIQLLVGTVFRTVLFRAVVSFIFIHFRAVFYWTVLYGTVLYRHGSSELKTQSLLCLSRS